MTLILSASTLSPAVGTTVAVSIESDSSGTVNFSCFYEAPPPGGFGPCKESRLFTFTSGYVTLHVPITEESWSGRSGRLELEATNRQGERESLALAVYGESLTADTQGSPS